MLSCLGWAGFGSVLFRLGSVYHSIGWVGFRHDLPSDGMEQHGDVSSRKGKVKQSHVRVKLGAVVFRRSVDCFAVVRRRWVKSWQGYVRLSKGEVW